MPYLLVRMRQYKLLIFLLLGCLSSFAQEIPSKPKGFVQDLAQLMSASEREALEQKLRAYDDSTSTQIGILTLNSLQGKDAYTLAIETAKAWGLGQKGKNNGALILLALEERKIRIVTGRGLEDELPDAVCKRIINRKMKPAFKAGKWYMGFDEAINEMMRRSSGAYRSEPSEGEALPLAIVLFLFLLLLAIAYSIYRSQKNHRGPGNRGGDLFFPPMFWGTGGGGFGSGSGGGGFDFGGFGGGDFGGGGAGGDF